MTEFATGYGGDSHVARVLAGRHTVCGWLSRVLDGDLSGAPPAPEEAGGTQELADALRKLSSAVPSDHPAPARSAANPGLDSRAESERVRLFVNAPGGVPAPPYGSWWLERTLQGEMTARLAAFYESEGLRAARGSGPADYLPAELEFLQFLLAHQRAAVATRQDALETQTRSREREFLERFLLNWVPDFCAKTSDATRDPFWLAVTDVLAALLEAEARRVGARA